MENRHTILYVDDEPDNLLAFKSIFRRTYQVLLAESGEEALRLLAEHPVQLLISDQRMPGMYGTELLEIARSQYPDLVRILLTGYSDLQAVIDAINKGKVYHYVTKPWRAEELDLIIRQALDVYELRTANRELTNERDLLRLRAAQQESEQVRAKFEILRNQINPHFLFNSLNILVSLIPADPQAATDFAGRFAKVYRRLLEFRDTPTVTLAEELAFTDDYLHLQETRFDEALRIEKQIEARLLDRKVPPFCLQLVIENALKHNVVSESQPLELRIFTEGEEIVVENNLQPRNSPADSTRIGLQNLSERYRLLADMSPVFTKSTDTYTARLPLLIATKTP